MKTSTNRVQLKMTKFFFGKQLKLEKRQKFNVELLLDENRLLFFEFKSTLAANSKWYLINNKGINILIIQMTLDKV